MKSNFQSTNIEKNSKKKTKKKLESTGLIHDLGHKILITSYKTNCFF